MIIVCYIFFSYFVFCLFFFFFFQAEDGIRDVAVTGVQTCALPIWPSTTRRAVGAIALTGSRRGAATAFAPSGPRTATARWWGCWRCVTATRSEERRVGKECRCRWSAGHEKKKKRKGKRGENRKH